MSDPDVQLIFDALRESDLTTAESKCRQLLQTSPERAPIWHLLGIVHAQQNQLSSAAECFESAIKFAGQNASYHYNLALARRSLKDLDGAIESYEKAVSLKPHFLEAQNNLGNCLLENGSTQESVDHFRELAKQFPEESVVQFNLGNVLEGAGEVNEAIAALRRAVELDPGFASARENLGRLLSDVQLYDEALEVWKDWLARDPNNAVAKHMLASITGENTPDRCDDDYVRDTFDRDFATSYDSQLERIGYRVPTLIGEAIDELDLRDKSLAVLDAGCGTGLCADALRPIASQLIGIDLSADMLQEAERRSIYDQIVECELTDFLTRTNQTFDLIISGDTLCYFGELLQVLSAAKRRLDRGGRLIFTVEQSDASDRQDFYLQANGRYQHQPSYVRRVLNDVGFDNILMRTETLRFERGRDVKGIVVLAQESL